MGIATADRLMLWKTEGHHEVNGALTAADMLEKSGLNWDVELRDIHVDNPDGSRTDGEHRKAIVRTDTNAILGVVKSRYVPFSNEEVFNFLDNLTDSGEAVYEAAWQWHGGETVGVALHLPEGLKVAGFDDHDVAMLVRTSHDGGGSLIVAPTYTRIGCTNQVNATIRGAVRKWKTTHSGTLDGKILQARQALELVHEYGDAWDQAVQKLLKQNITQDRFAEIAKEMFGEKRQDEVVQLRKTSDNIADFRRTAYGAYNALTEYAQWSQPRNPHLDSLERGTIGRQTARAYELVSA